MKRLIALLLSALVLSGALFSCARGSSSNNSPSKDDSFAKADYKGEEFTFLDVKHTETITDYYGGSYLDADTYPGNTVSSAVYERNLAVEEKYNLKIKELIKIGSDPKTVITSYRLSGDICFDAVYGWGYKLFSCIPDGSFADIAALEGVDLSRSYWAPSALEDLKINGSLFVATNDISMNRIKWADVVFVNNEVLEGESSNLSLSDLALSGDWTYDKYLRLICDYSSDGTYGLVTDDSSGSYLAHGCGIYYTQRNSDGIGLNLSNEKLFTLINDACKVYSNESIVASPGSLPASDTSEPWESAIECFASGKALFLSSYAYNAGLLRSKGANYTILPVPKYDEAQESYNSTVSALASMFAILPEVRSDMKTAGHERTGTVLEYMAYKSESIVFPSYAESILYLQDEGYREADYKLLCAVKDSTRYEFCELYSLTDITNLAKAMFQHPQAAEGAYSRHEKKLSQKLYEIYESLPAESEN